MRHSRGLVVPSSADAVAPETTIRLEEEHDRFAWVPPEEGSTPGVVGRTIAAAVGAME